MVLSQTKCLYEFEKGVGLSGLCSGTAAVPVQTGQTGGTGRLLWSRTCKDPSAGFTQPMVTQVGQIRGRIS